MKCWLFEVSGSHTANADFLSMLIGIHEPGHQYRTRICSFIALLKKTPLISQVS